MQIENKIGVTDHLSDRPSNEHATIERGRRGGGGIPVDDWPDDEQAGGDLQKGCEERGADNSWGEALALFCSEIS